MLPVVAHFDAPLAFWYRLNLAITASSLTLTHNRPFAKLASRSGNAFLSTTIVGLST
jgi:hypothetical protein